MRITVNKNVPLIAYITYIYKQSRINAPSMHVKYMGGNIIIIENDSVHICHKYSNSWEELW